MKQIFADLWQVSVLYFTFAEQLHTKRATRAFIFLNILDMGISLMREKTSKLLLDFFIYLNSNLYTILNECGITNALESGVPSDDRLHRHWKCSYRFHMYRNHKCFQQIVSSRVINLHRDRTLFILFKLQRRRLRYCLQSI